VIGKIQPVKLTVSSQEELSTIFKAARKLSNHKDGKFSQISIGSDLTPLERQERNSLRAERFYRQEEADTSGIQAKWIIRRGRVVNMQRRQQDPEEKKEEV